MKISKLFHYLYAAIMFLPLLLLPVFMIYSHRHDLSTDITIQQDVYKDFYQGVKNGKPISLDNWEEDYGTINYEDNSLTLYTWSNEPAGVFTYISLNSINDNDYLYLSFYINVEENDLDVLNISNFGSIVFDDTFDITTNFVFQSFIYQCSDNSVDSLQFSLEGSGSITYLQNIQIFNLTSIFGSGNEPTKEVFETYLTQDYYDFGNNQVKVGTTQVPVKNNDIMSVFMDSYNNSLNKYFNMRRVFNLESLYQWFNVNFFASAAPIGFNILFNLFVYWLFVSLLWLLFDFFMYIPLVIHNGIDKARIE